MDVEMLAFFWNRLIYFDDLGFYELGLLQLVFIA